MQFRQHVRDLAARLLIEANTIAAAAVYTERDTPVETGEAAVLSVCTPMDGGHSRGAGEPKFRSTLTLRVDATVQGMVLGTVVRQLDQLTAQVEDALLTDPRFVSMKDAHGHQLVEEIVSKETHMEVNASGDRHVGRAAVLIGLRYSERFQPIIRTPLASVALTVNARLAPPPPLAVAIRFDAWYGASANAGSVESQVAAMFSPAGFNYRLPWFATVSGGAASWPQAAQSVMDQEILDAASANIGAFAFVSFQPTDTETAALTLYLASANRAAVGFCMLGSMSNWNGTGAGADPAPGVGPPYAASVQRDVTMFLQAGYVKVLGARPFYPVLLSGSQADDASAIAWVRRASIMQGTGEPYIVALTNGSAGPADPGFAAAIGADANGAYAPGPAQWGDGAPYSQLVAGAEADWQFRLGAFAAGAHIPMVPTAVTGFNVLPEVVTPEPISNPGYTMQSWWADGTPAEIAQHAADAVAFVRQNPQACEAGVALISAWNEIEAMPLFRTWISGEPLGDSSRLTALAAALAPPAGALPSLSATIALPQHLPR